MDISVMHKKLFHHLEDKSITDIITGEIVIHNEDVKQVLAHNFRLKSLDRYRVVQEMIELGLIKRLNKYYLCLIPSVLNDLPEKKKENTLIVD